MYQRIIKVGLALEKYNAQIKSVSYEVRSLDMSRLIESGDDLQAEDDGKYLHISLTLKDLLTQGRRISSGTEGTDRRSGSGTVLFNPDLPGNESCAGLRGFCATVS